MVETPRGSRAKLEFDPKLAIVEGQEGAKRPCILVPDRSPFEADLQDIRRLPSRAIKVEVEATTHSKRRHSSFWGGTARQKPSRRSRNHRSEKRLTTPAMASSGPGQVDGSN
jgi:hypothetical protein